MLMAHLPLCTHRSPAVESRAHNAAGIHKVIPFKLGKREGGPCSAAEYPARKQWVVGYMADTEDHFVMVNEPDTER